MEQTSEKLKNRVRELEKQLEDARRKFDKETAELKNDQRNVLIQHRLCKDLSTSSNTNDAFELILDSIEEISGLKYSGIYVFDKKTESFSLVAHKGVSENFSRSVLSIEKASRLSEIFFTGKPMYVDLLEMDLHDDFPRFLEEFRYVLVLPVLHQEEIHSYICAASKKKININPSTRTAAEAIASQVSVILSHIEIMETLTESEKMYREIFNSSMNGLQILDLEGNPIEINPAMCRMQGLTREEVLSQHIRNIVHPESYELLSEYLSAVAGGRDFRCVAKNVKRDGSIIYVEVLGTPIEYRGKKCILSVVSDITDRKRAEIALIKNEQRFRKLIELSPIPISVLSSDGRFEYFNSRFHDLFGYSADEIRTRSEWFEKAFPDPEYREKVMSVWKSYLHYSGLFQERPREFIVRCANGRDRIINFFPVTMDNGKEFVTYLDITDQRTREEKLKFHSVLMGQIRDHIIATDLRGVIIYANQATLDSLEFKNEELLGKHIGMLGRTAEEIDTLRSIINTVAEEGKWVGEISLYSRGDTRIDLDGRYWFLRDDDGDPLGIIGIGTDITERKQIQKDLEESRGQLRTLSRSLISTQEKERTRIARELHDQTGKYLTILSLKTGELMKAHPSDRQEYLSMIEIIQSLTEEVRRICRGLQPMKLEKLGLKEAVKSLLAEFNDRKMLKIETSLNLEEFGRLDPDFEINIYRIIQESITNILKHSGAENAFVSIGNDTDNVYLKITDDGKGMALDSTDGETGLTSIKERTAIIEGHIETASVPGQGTSINIVAPLHRFRRKGE